MARHYEGTRRYYGLTDEQYRRAVAAHELGHAITAEALPTTGGYEVQVRDDPEHGVYGLALVGPKQRDQQIDPQDRATELMAGEIAKARWLQQEGSWSPDVAYMVRRTGAGDRELIDELGLTPEQRRDAQERASKLVDQHWTAITNGVDQVASTGGMNARQLRTLARTGRTRGVIASLFGR